MIAVRSDLVLGPVRQVRRAALLWALGLAFLVAATIAVWPEFRGSSAISQAMDKLPKGIVQAFGLQGFGTPAGFLRGNLYDFFIPLLLAGVAVFFASSLTAGEEDAGRLELFFAQPVSRRALFAGRAAAGLLCLAVLAALTTAVQFGSDAAFGLSIAGGRLGATLALTALLAIFHGCLALAVAAVRARPSLVLGVGLGVLVAGMVISSLFPVVSGLAPFAHVSPWDWAFGGNPLANPTAPWRYLALGLPAAAMALFSVAVIGRRDIRAA